MLSAIVRNNETRLGYTNYHPVITAPYVPPRRETLVDPWPSYQDTMTVARAWYVKYSAPARPFPALAFVEEERARRIGWCPIGLVRPRTLTQELQAMRQELWLTSDRAKKSSKPKRKIGWFERQIDKLIAWRQGWRNMDDVLLHS